MPDVKTFEQIAAGHGIAVALLIMATLSLATALVAVWRENRSLYLRIEALLKERLVALEHLLEVRDEGRSNRR